MKILEKKGTDITNIDGAAFNNFTAAGRDGILKGVLNECRVYLAASNIIAVATGELIVQGVRIKLDEEQSFSLTSTPSQAIRYHIVVKAERNQEDIAVTLFLRPVQALQQQALYQEDSGIYEAELARFTHETSGDITDFVRTLDVITGGAGNAAGSDFTVGKVTSETLTTGEAEVDVENRYDPEQGKVVTDFHFGIPQTDTSNLVKKSGDTMTGNLTINVSGATPLILKRENSIVHFGLRKDSNSVYTPRVWRTENSKSIGLAIHPDGLYETTQDGDARVYSEHYPPPNTGGGGVSIDSDSVQVENLYFYEAYENTLSYRLMGDEFDGALLDTNSTYLAEFVIYGKFQVDSGSADHFEAKITGILSQGTFYQLQGYQRTTTFYFDYFGYFEGVTSLTPSIWYDSTSFSLYIDIHNYNANQYNIDNSYLRTDYAKASFLKLS